MDADDRDLFERSVRNAVDTSSGPALDAALGDLGWHDALVSDRRTAVAVLFELQGRATASSSALGAVLLDALGVDAPGAVVLPALGSVDPAGVLAGGRVTGAGLVVGGFGDATTVALPTRAHDGVAVALVEPGHLTTREVNGLDPRLGLVEVTAETIEVAELRAVGDWPAAVSLGQLAVGHELVGASRRMLELARDHALERVQFGRPIAAFQAVRHRLAETLVAIETAEALLDAAWLDGSATTAAMAKAMAGRSARTAARHCQQVLAGIGFTTEHDFHRSLRRVLLLDELFGSSRSLTRALGDDLLATRSLPPLLPL